jgi:3-oxoisoapionate decarboxylase
MTTRREVLAAASAAAAWLPVRPARAQAPGKQMHNLGGAPAGFGARTRAGREGNQPFDFVDHCHSLGLGVVETRLASTDPEAIKKLRQKLDSYNMRVILDIPLPRDQNGAAAFDAAVKAAKEAGAFSLHAAMTQRRYEQFDTLEAFKSDFERCQKTIAMAEPILRKHQLRLGIENHKGWRAVEQAAWMKRVSSEWVGVHFDFGNNVSLCEDPADTLRILLPHVVASHIKDMAVEPYEDGFLLSEVPLGEGFLKLREMVQTLRTKDPNLPLDLEMITREPLKIPVFTDKYWATFDDSYSPLPGRDLARMLELVRKNKPKNPLPRTAGLNPAAQAKLEDENNLKSIHYAQQHLNV